MILVSLCEENGSGDWVQLFPPHLHCSELFACGMLRSAEMRKKKKKSLFS